MSKNVLIDVRTTEEYQCGHMPNSINIPLAAITHIVNHVPDKNMSISVYCKSGARATQAKSILESMGYTNVTNIGGFN